MRRSSCIGMVLVILLTLFTTPLFAARSLQAKSLDNAPFPDYDFSRANKLPLTGYFNKSFNINGMTRNAKFYISPEAPVRAFFIVIAVPDGVNTEEFLVASGWKDIADANESGIFVLEPGTSGWGTAEAEQAYINAANAFYKANRYFSIFGENYLVGYGKGGSALESWAAANPLFVISQVFVNSASQGDDYYAGFAKKLFDGLNTGNSAVEIPATIKIPYNDVPVPTWFINEQISNVAKGIAYWKGASDCQGDATVNPDYLLGSSVFAQDKQSKAWQTAYCGPISKIATLEAKVDTFDPKTSKVIYDFLTEYIRYDNTTAYGNQLGLREPYGEIGTMMVNGFLREYMIYAPASAATLWPNGAPVLFVFAGNSQTDKVFWYATQWWKVADKEGVILVLPCEQYSSNSTVVSHKDNDIFVPQLMKLVKEKYKVDPTRFYATGQSAGSMATQSFGMTNPEYFAAIASTSGVGVPGGGAALNALLDKATYKTMPTYAIIGEGDMADMIGDLWDNRENNLDAWAAYYLKANGVGPVGNGMNIERDGRYTTYTWKNSLGFPMVKLTKTAWRAHNNIPAEMPILWNFLKLWSYKDGVRYFGGAPLSTELKATSLENKPTPPYNYTRANKLPLTGYFEKSFNLNGTMRTAKVYIAPNASVRAYFTVIAIPENVSTDDFVQKSGWKDIADFKEEGLLFLEPGSGGWGSPESELAYLNAAINFYRGNGYFSIFGEHYLVGYGKGGTALEAWAALNPLQVCSQVYIDSSSQSDAFYAQFASKKFDGLSSGYKKIEIPENKKVSYSEVPVPTWYINTKLSDIAKGAEYWKAANDCVTEGVSREAYLSGSTVFAQSKDSDAWQTDYCGPISKVALLEKKVSPWDVDSNRALYKFLTEYVRYDTSTAYGNQLGIRAPYGEFFTMTVNAYEREYMVYVPDSAAKLWPSGAPAIVVFPGDSQTDKVFWPATQWWKVADKEGVILLTLCEQYSRNSTVVSHKDNEYFVPLLLDVLKKKYNVDETRIYATGQSAGSVASQGFGMSNPEYFAAIASTSGVGNFNAAAWEAQLKTATYKSIPTYAIIGEGDIEGMTGTPWDGTVNQLDQWLGYYSKVNGIAFLGNNSLAIRDGRFITAKWNNSQGFPMVMWTQTLYRAHNCIPVEMPMLYDYMKHWSFKDGIRYYDGVAVSR